MASYTSNLKSWGATGQEYPDGYSYLEGEQPVDAWDNFVTSEVISDIKDHLIPLTNGRVESDKGVAGGEPTSPDASHLYYDEDNERLEAYDSAEGAWHGLMKVDGDTMEGALDMGGYDISNAGAATLDGVVNIQNSRLDMSGRGVVRLHGDGTAGNPQIDWYNNDEVTARRISQYFSAAGDYLGFADKVNNNDILTIDIGGNVEVPNGQLSEQGARVATRTWALQDAAGTVAESNLSFDTATQAELDALALGDLSDVTATGEGSGNGFDADTVDGQHAGNISTGPAPVRDQAGALTWRSTWEATNGTNYTKTLDYDIWTRVGPTFSWDVSELSFVTIQGTYESNATDGNTQGRFYNTDTNTAEVTSGQSDGPTTFSGVINVTSISTLNLRFDMKQKDGSSTDCTRQDIRFKSCINGDDIV